MILLGYKYGILELFSFIFIVVLIDRFVVQILILIVFLINLNGFEGIVSNLILFIQVIFKLFLINRVNQKQKEIWEYRF